MQKFKLDAFTGKQIQHEMEELKKKLISCDFNFESKVSEISKYMHGELKDRFNLIDKCIDQNTKGIRHQAAKHNLFENKIETILKAGPGEAPVKRAEIDQEKLRYLERKIISLTKDFETLNDSVKGRVNEIFIDLNKKCSSQDLDEREVKLLGKLDELMESLIQKFVNKETVRKHVKEIERHILYWYDWIMNLDKIKQDIEEDDGTLFSKKKLEGLSWASCGTSAKVYSGVHPTVTWDKMIGNILMIII